MNGKRRDGGSEEERRLFREAFRRRLCERRAGVNCQRDEGEPCQSSQSHLIGAHGWQTGDRQPRDAGDAHQRAG